MGCGASTAGGGGHTNATKGPNVSRPAQSWQDVDERRRILEEQMELRGLVGGASTPGRRLHKVRSEPGRQSSRANSGCGGPGDTGYPYGPQPSPGGRRPVARQPQRRSSAENGGRVAGESQPSRQPVGGIQLRGGAQSGAEKQSPVLPPMPPGFSVPFSREMKVRKSTTSMGTRRR